MGSGGSTGSGGSAAARRRELGACLRAYRQIIEPASVGLPAGGRRRTGGLRREDVAALAGVSLTWYTALEQGRVTASSQVLDAVGRVLRLDDVGRRHLCHLAAPAPGPAAPTPSTPSTPTAGPYDGLDALIGGWPASPAAVLDHRLDVVATNTAWHHAWGDPAGDGPARRHVLWQLAAKPAAAGLIQPLARQFRMAADLHAGDARIAEIGALLRADHPALGPVWDCRGVGAFGRPTIDLAAGAATAHLLHPTGEPDATAILVLTG